MSYTDHGWRHAPKAQGGTDPIPAVGDYVFLQEIIVADDGDPIVFDPISQAYRHLVVELLGASTGSFNVEDRLAVWWNGAQAGVYGYTEAWWWGSSDEGAEGSDTDHQWVNLDYVMPNGDLEVAGLMGSVTLKFPYYSVADVQKNVMWQSAGQDNLDAVANVLATVGGGTKSIVEADGDPIVDLSLAPRGDSAGWKAGSRASLYGIS